VAFNAATTFATQKDMDTKMFPMSPEELIAKEQKGNQQMQKKISTNERKEYHCLCLKTGL
jgi:hypothetical protein